VPVPLLKTKIFIPPVHRELVSRPRLIERLDEGIRLGHKLTFISAPAGFGKTTLVSEWIRRRDGAQVVPSQVGWLSLDEGDNDPVRFWRYFIAALQSAEPSIGQTAQGVLETAQPQSPPIEALLTTLINDLAERADLQESTCVLVLDDYHVITAPEIHSSLDFLLAHLPPTLHLVITTREDPPLSLSHLRGRRQLTEVRARDLRFTSQETDDLLNVVMGLDLTAEDIATLLARTEGWVVGLQMAAIPLQGQAISVKHDFVRAFAGDDRYIADYLSDQVLQSQPPHVQIFLLQTSILERLCGPLCNALTGRNDGQAILHDLEDANLFVVPLDNRRHWYRYHRLFADLLRSRLDERIGVGSTSSLHLCASEWYEGEGFLEDAISHALSAADLGRAASLVERAALPAVYRGEFVLLRRWLEAIPEEAIRARPVLCIADAWRSLPYSTGLAEQRIRDAEAALDARSDDARESGEPECPAHDVVAANASALRVAVARIRKEPAARIAKLCQESLSQISEQSTDLRSILAFWLGQASLDLGDRDGADRAFDMVVQMERDSESHTATLALAGLRAQASWSKGRLHDAAEICKRTLQTIVEPAERGGQRLPMSCYLYIILGKVYLQRNELERAEHLSRRGIKLSELTTEYPIQADGYCALSKLRGIQGDFEEALMLLDRAEQAMRTWQGEPGFVPALRVRIWLRRAQVENEPQYLQRAIEWAESQEIATANEYSFALQSLAWTRIAQYRRYGEPDLEPLLDVLDEQLELARTADRIGGQVEVLALQGMALQAQGRTDKAVDALQSALPLAKREGFVRHLLDHGPPMGALLHQVAAKGIAIELVGQLLSALAEEHSGAEIPLLQAVPAAMPGTERGQLIEPLSPRELEVLQLIASGASNPEIAQQLYISVNTVKKHVTNIFGKLSATSRTQAVARGRDLGLVE
jgi:LuxR family maltose regulon positive regulatory protein